jgi:hypothetical protein
MIAEGSRARSFDRATDLSSCCPAGAAACGHNLPAFVIFPDEG